MAKFCPECGVLGTETAKFCSACGARITTSDSASSVAREDKIYTGMAWIALGCLFAFFFLFIQRSVYAGIFGFFAILFLFAWALHHAVKIRKTE
jgi:uncharacterized membrane protein